MNWLIILSISKTHLLSRLKQSSIAALGVTFGIGTFIILVSFMTGLNKMLDDLVLDRTPHVHIYNEIKPSKEQPLDLIEDFAEDMKIIHSVKPKKSQARIHNALPMLTMLENDPRVLGVTPQVQAQVFYVSGSIELNGIINGVEIQDEIRLFNLDDYVLEGDASDLARVDNGIILGAGLAEKMSLKIGDRVQVTSTNGSLFQMKVIALYQSGLADIDNVQSYANLKLAQRIMEEGNNYITDIQVKLHDINLSEEVAAEITRNFDLTAIDINTANAQFEAGNTIRNIITYAVSVTLLVVAGFGIYNILNMMIYEKMNDIAILKATGFSGGDVQRIFISQAMIIGLVGGIFGLLFGFLVSVAIDHAPFEIEALPTIKTYPVNFNGTYYLIGVIFALTATFFAGYFPSRRAKKIDPVDIIRGT
jgi:lipoprotein-releasing system permease protein